MKSVTLVTLVTLALPVGAQELLNAESLTISSIDDVEISPDGRWAVAREHAGFLGGVSHALFYELATGTQVAALPIDAGNPWNLLTGPAQDAVVVSNDRAVVLASGIGIYDTSPAVPVSLHVQDVGVWPRDVAMTPDGAFAVVRGGRTTVTNPGGLFVFDLQTGQQVAHAPGEPRPYGPLARGFDVDSVVADDRHAVTLSAQDGQTRVSVWSLRPPSGGPPEIVFEVDQPGLPHDLVQVPGGRLVAVRSEVAVGLYRLRGNASGRVWLRHLHGNPGPIGGASMDSIEATGELVATSSRFSNGGVGAQLDVFTLDGQSSWANVAGDPHDLAITPDATRLVLRTSDGVSLFDLTALAPGRIAPADSASQQSTNTSWSAGLDSVAVTDSRVVTLARAGSVTDVRVFDSSAGSLVELASVVLPDLPVDVDLTPDGSLGVLTGLTYVQVLDLADGSVRFEHDPSTSPSQYPWCDGVAVNADRAVAFGYIGLGAPTPGWVSVLALDAPSP